MTETSFDVVIFGSGPAGSVLAMTLCRQGLQVLLVERQKHPRFAIGESTTPLGNLILETLGHRYQLPELVSISEYGRWQRDVPHLSCGLKRGFSFFFHREGEPFHPGENHAHELLVAASPDDASADTHWLRADVDEFLMQRAVAAGATYWDLASLQSAHRECDLWTLHIIREGNTHVVTCRFVCDASGPGGSLAKKLVPQYDELPDPPLFQTRSRSLYNHFDQMPRWQSHLAQREITTTNHPFPCDAAALHHVFDGGWMWVLRLDSGVVSAGFSLCPEKFPLASAGAPLEEWNRMLQRFPGIAEQFRDSRTLREWVQTGDMQYRSKQMAGPGFVQLPHAAYFLDPLFSPGMAHSFLAVERLAEILGTHAHDWTTDAFDASIMHYAMRMVQEMEHIDTLLAGCHRSMHDFSAFVAQSMLYFSGAILHEEARRRDAAKSASLGFLSSHLPSLQMAAHENWQQIQARPSDLTPQLQSRAQELIAKHEVKPLRTPAMPHMYPY